MWQLDYKKSWALKNWYFWTVVLEKTLESPLDCKEIKPVNPKGNQSWIFIGRTDAEAEAPILWPPDVKNWLIWMLGKIEGRRRRGWQRMRWHLTMASLILWTWVWANSGSWWWTGKPGVLYVVHGVTKNKTWLSNWTTTPCLWLLVHSSYQQAGYAWRRAVFSQLLVGTSHLQCEPQPQRRDHQWYWMVHNHTLNTRGLQSEKLFSL